MLTPSAKAKNNIYGNAGGGVSIDLAAEWKLG